ncbi:store-operated calcium entry-associated regulatory factor isoform X2 [Meriones unguiculatus]|uniref:store-operated calcium entry-associated regulatory factor isoform X2 n=1 Tax=Meriones unguiculatus TaxID=10047 RepID=UPI00293F009F|nr:store-operated calcium entry-associated regulatory factor isoform X2 [Meriones unguiculatus]
MAVAAVGLPGAACCWLLRLLSFLLVAGPALCWNDPDRILLRDVKALTLHHDRYTTSRRLDPIPQLKCVGGTAGCDAFTPKVIQCQNKGWDGYDVQWECKTDLDIAYKFGKTVVSCEGYESSEDQYVLRGSCGLEYNLDYTELGLKKLKESGKHQGFSDYYHKLYSSDSSGVGGLVTIGVLLALAYVVYKLFLSDGQGSPPPYSEYPPYSQHYSRFTSAAGAPPPGFKSEFTASQYGAPTVLELTLQTKLANPQKSASASQVLGLKDHRTLAMVQLLALGVLLQDKAVTVQGRASGLAWVLEDC